MFIKVRLLILCHKKCSRNSKMRWFTFWKHYLQITNIFQRINYCFGDKPLLYVTSSSFVTTMDSASTWGMLSWQIMIHLNLTRAFLTNNNKFRFKTYQKYVVWSSPRDPLNIYNWKKLFNPSKPFHVLLINATQLNIHQVNKYVDNIKAWKTFSTAVPFLFITSDKTYKKLRSLRQHPPIKLPLLYEILLPLNFSPKTYI